MHGGGARNDMDYHVDTGALEMHLKISMCLCTDDCFTTCTKMSTGQGV